MLIQNKVSPWLLVLALAAPVASLGCSGGDGGGGVASPTGGDAEGGALVGSKAPEISAAYVMGDGPKTLGEATGKVVILDFWATYCDPCKKSFPKYQELVDQFGGDLTVIAISVDDPEDASQNKLEEFVNATGVKFSIVWDKDQSAAKKYSPPKMPTSFVIDREGKIRFVHAGYETGEEAKIAKEVESLLD